MLLHYIDGGFKWVTLHIGLHMS